MSTVLTTTQQTFVVEIPNETNLPFDPNQDFDWSLVYPQNYMSAEWLEEYRETNASWIQGHVVGVGLEVVQDPENPVENKAPDLVLYLAGGLPRVVMNKTRCKLMTQITRTRNPKLWAEQLRGKVLEFKVGTVKEMSRVPQVIFKVVSEGENYNEQLFGFTN